jgi:hypothetical protein
MNPTTTLLTSIGSISPRVEFFRLPAPGKRDPHFGLSRGWYYKAAALGEIRMIAVRQRGALRGVRLVVYDSVADYIWRSARTAAGPVAHVVTASQLPIAFEES